MAMHVPRVVESNNLSTAWLQVLGGTLLEPGFEPLHGPVIVSVPIGVSGYPDETDSVRELMDSVLEKKDKPTSYDSASTIFPLSTWLSQKRSPSGSSANTTATKYSHDLRHFIVTTNAELTSNV